MLIGITGKARSGKDTFAEILSEEIFNVAGKKFILMAYAHELKLRAQEDFDLSYEQLWGVNKEVSDYRYRKSESADTFWTPREILQSYGEFFRSIDNNFWVGNLFRVIDSKDYNNVIITDIRYPNEAIPVTERSGYVIKVTSDRENIEKIHGENHTSETAMDDYKGIDFHVRNDGTLEDLRGVARQVVKFLKDSENIKKNLEVQNGQE